MVDDVDAEHDVGDVDAGDDGENVHGHVDVAQGVEDGVGADDDDIAELPRKAWSFLHASDAWHMFLPSLFPLRPARPMARGHPTMVVLGHSGWVQACSLQHPLC